MLALNLPEWDSDWRSAPVGQFPQQWSESPWGSSPQCAAMEPTRGHASSAHSNQHSSQHSTPPMTPTPDTARLCKFYSSGGCTKGSLCPYSHNLTVNAVSNADATRGFVLTGHVVNLRVADDASAVGAKCSDSLHQMNPSAAPFVCSSEVYGTASSSYEQIYHQEYTYPPLYDGYQQETADYYSHTAPYDSQAWDYGLPEPENSEDLKWTPSNVFQGTQQMRHAASRFQVDYAEEVQPDPALLQHRRMQAMRSPLQTKRSGLSASQTCATTELPEVSSRRRAPAAPPSSAFAAPLNGPLFHEKDMARVEVRSAEAHRRLRNRSDS